MFTGLFFIITVLCSYVFYLLGRELEKAKFSETIEAINRIENSKHKTSELILMKGESDYIYPHVKITNYSGKTVKINLGSISCH